MRIDAIHTRLKMILDMAQAGDFSPEEMDEALDVWSKKIFNDYLPIYGIDSDSREALNPFKVFADFETNTVGEFTVADSERLVSVLVRGMVDDKPVERDATILNDDEVGGRINSELTPVDIMYPVIEDLGNKKYGILPRVETGGRVGYITIPKKPKFAYAPIVSDEEPVYDDANSVQLQWSDKYVDRIILGAIGVLGINLSNQMLQQLGFSVAAEVGRK